VNDVVLPLQDVDRSRRMPWFTYGLIAANVVVFLFTPAANTNGVESAPLQTQCQQEAYYERYAAIPREMVDNQQLPTVTTGDVKATGCVVGPPTYTKIPALSVLYAMFLHGGWLHLLGNMLFLWVFGNHVEARLGRWRYLLFYLLAGYVAAYGFALTNPSATQPMVGASGAIAGVLGAFMVLFPRDKIWGVIPELFFLPVKLPAWFVLGLWFALQAVYAAGYAVSGAGSVAYLAHVFGFVFGVIVALPLLLWLARKRRPQPRPSALIYRRDW
jgi:rhomboid family protein